MEKKNEQAVKNNETMELTPEQMDKVSGGAGSEGFDCFYCRYCSAEFPSISERIKHEIACPGYRVAPNPQPAPLPKPDDEKIAPVG